MAKLDWARTLPGRDGYDADLARQWKSGPMLADLEMPDGSDRIDYLASPNVHWARNLARLWPVESDETRLSLFKTAADTARTLVYRLGWAAARERVTAFHKRASARSLFPSDYFAIYFDFWVSVFCRGEIERSNPLFPSNAPKFLDYDEFWVRALSSTMEMKRRNVSWGLYHTMPGHLSEMRDRLHEAIRSEEAERGNGK